MDIKTRAVTYSFYLALLALAGAGEYLHLIPSGSAATIMGGILGHGISEISQVTGANKP